MHTCFYPIILRTLDYLDIGLVDHYASGTVCSKKLGDLTVPLAYWIIMLTHIYASLICPTTFQVASRYDAQRYALQNLPGRHLWRRSELSKATGFSDEPEKLMAHIRFLYGMKWKEFLGTVLVVVVAPVSPHIWLFDRCSYVVQREASSF